MTPDTTYFTTAGSAAVAVTISGRSGVARWGGTLATGETVALSSAVLQHERIVVDRNILNGEPHVRGTRIPASVILDGLEERLTPEELIAHFPRLTLEDIRAALEYSAMATWPAV